MITCSSRCHCGAKVLIGLNESTGSSARTTFIVPCPLCDQAVEFTVTGAMPDQAPQTIAYERAERTAPAR
jgi:hypothetical protein